jgi:anhydro-N-acetylmuramic acid kinase
VLVANTIKAIGLMSGTSLDGVDVALIETDGEHIAGFGPIGYRTYSDDAEAVATYLDAEQIDKADVAIVGFHGQTVLHRPAERLTVQIGDGAALARRLGIPVVYDFRAADVAAGGQGAPLVPVFHQALARDLHRAHQSRCSMSAASPM